MRLNELLELVIVVSIMLDFFDIFAGVGMCIGGLKWRKNLIAIVALHWGAALGFFLGASFNDLDLAVLLTIMGAIVFPIAAYTDPAANRFILGFIVILKLTFLITVPLAKEGSMEIGTALLFPFVTGTLGGLFFLVWTQVKMGAFILACTFLGASEVAPVIEKYVSRGMFAITKDISWVLDPIDFIFAQFKIELTSKTTFVIMCILMVLGIGAQIQSVKSQGFELSDPVIAYETDDRSKFGKIHRY